MIRLFKKSEPDLEFVDKTRMVYQRYPVQKAADVKPLSYDVQRKKYGQHKFVLCPGTTDYANYGYIIPAWTDINIKANRAGIAHSIGSKARGDRGFEAGRFMDSELVDGLLEPSDGVPLKVLHFGCPWRVFGNGKVSALVMPAFYHSKIVHDLHIWPGIVDYENFHVINMIVSPKRECEVKIRAGEPLLHVLPFWNKSINAGYGPGTDEQIDISRNEVPGDDKQFYRKHFSIKKVFDLWNSMK